MNLETEGKISQAVPNFLKHYCFRSSHLRCSAKKVFLEISQNLQENTCARDSFLRFYSNSPLESPLRNLEATPLLSFKYRQTYLNTLASNRTHKKTKKKEKNRKKRNIRNKMK